MIKLLANENFPKANVSYLRSQGYDVLYIAEEHSSISDESVMQIAQAEERLILTFDRDYGELLFRYGYQPVQGVVYLRIPTFLPDEPGKLVYHILSKLEIETERRFTVCTTGTIRQRMY